MSSTGRIYKSCIQILIETWGFLYVFFLVYVKAIFQGDDTSKNFYEISISNLFDIHGSVHRRLFDRNTNKMQLCNTIYYSEVYGRLNMFRAAHRLSSGALNCICILWFIYPCGDRSLPWQRPVATWAYKPEAANTV